MKLALIFDLMGKIGLTGLIFSMVIAAMPFSASEDLLELSTGAEIEVQRYHGDGAATMLWLPSERGLSAAQQVQARALAGLGHQVWLADLHNSYFVQPGRNSIGQFPLDDIVALIDAVVASSTHRVVLVSSSRGAQSALIAAREWHRRNPGNPAIAGIILVHAHLYKARPGPGD